MSRYKTLLVIAAGIVLILGTNFVAISGAKWNRSGATESLLELTERELRLRNHWRRENSGSSFILNVNYGIQTSDTGNPRGNRTSQWLSMDKLKEIGIDFDISGDTEQLRRRVRKQLPVGVFLVIEYDGEAYQSDLRAAQNRLYEAEALLVVNSDSVELNLRKENAEKQLNFKQNHASRLYVIDTGLDPEVLRQQYSDRSRYMIVTGRIRVVYQGRDEAEPYVGYISGIDIDEIHITKKHRPLLDNLPAPDTDYQYSYGYPPRYSVRLAYGNRYEPWVVDVRGL